MTLLELAQLLRKHLRILIILPLVCTIAAAAVCWGVLADEYTASVSMYVLTTTDSSYSDGLSSSDLSASQYLTNDVVTLIESDRVASDAAEELSMSSLAGYELSVESSTDTRVITLSVTGESAQAVAIVANQIAETTNDVAQEIMDVEAVNIIDHASEPTSPSGPNRVLYTAVALLAGIFLAIALIVLIDMTNTRVRSPEEAEELLGIPVIGRIPAFKD